MHEASIVCIVGLNSDCDMVCPGHFKSVSLKNVSASE